MNRILTILFVILTILNVNAQDKNIILSDIENSVITQLPNGLKIQIIKTSQFEYCSYRLSADISSIGEGLNPGIKKITADLTGCDLIPNDILIKTMISHKQAIDSTLEFLESVINGGKYTNFESYKTSKIKLLKDPTDKVLVDNCSSKSIGESIENIESLKKLNTQDIDAYIKLCFSPERCLLTIVTNEDPSVVISYAQKHFSTLTKVQNKTQPEILYRNKGDLIYYIEDNNTSNVEIAFRSVFHSVKSPKNLLLNNIAFRILFPNLTSFAQVKTSINDEIFVFNYSIDENDFNILIDDFYKPRNPNFTFSTSQNAKEELRKYYNDMLVRPEFVAEIASYIPLYKFPKNYFTNFDNNINSISNSEISDYVKNINNNGTNIMIVKGKRETLLCTLLNTAKYREIDFINSNLIPLRVIAKGFDDKTIINDYLNKTGLINSPKNIVEDFISKYTFSDGSYYSCKGKISRKYPLMYKMENYVMHTQDSLIFHFLEMFDGTIGNDSTILYGCVPADSLRNKVLRQKASFPIESYYSQLGYNTKFICNYELDTAGVYLIDIKDKKGHHYHDYFSNIEYTKKKTEIINQNDEITTTITYDNYIQTGQYLLPTSIIEKSSNLKISTTINTYNISANLKKTDFQPIIPIVKKKK
ncbi:MAG: insulinase family protein [Bacteroidales bacterium]|nr:insulinase family protein [Bacteroidales bacterium]